jgi:hypothetical protein
MKNRVKGWLDRVRKLLGAGVPVPIPAAIVAVLIAASPGHFPPGDVCNDYPSLPGCR